MRDDDKWREVDEFECLAMVLRQWPNELLTTSWVDIALDLAEQAAALRRET